MPEEKIPAVISGEPPEPVQPTVVAPFRVSPVWRTLLLLLGGPLLQIAAQFFSNYLTTRGIINVGLAHLFLMGTALAFALLIVLCTMALASKGRIAIILSGVVLVIATFVALDRWVPNLPKSASIPPPSGQPERPPQTIPDPPKARVQRAPKPSGLHSKIQVVDSKGVVIHNKISGEKSLTITVWFQNFGDLAAIGAVRSSFIDILDHEISEAEESEILTKVSTVRWNASRADDEIQPGEKRFFSFPDDDSGAAQIASRARDVIDGKAMLYLFFVQKYRDRSMRGNEVNVTEFGGWFTGGGTLPEGNLEVRHIVGRNRIFQEIERGLFALNRSAALGVQ